MTHRLTDLQIARLVGAQAFSRGEQLADHGHVGRIMWSESGNRVFAPVNGSGRNNYVASVTFQRTASGALTSPVGSCTCPVGSNCKHVAALLMMSHEDEQYVDKLGELPFFDYQVLDAVAEARAIMQSARDAARLTAAEPRTPSWQTALAPLVQQQRQAAQLGSPLALQFALYPAERAWHAPASPLAPPRLGVRPMTVGKSGKWIKGNLNWQNLGYDTTIDQAQRSVLLRIESTGTQGNSYYSPSYSSIEDVLYLESFPSATLWQLLEQAH